MTRMDRPTAQPTPHLTAPSGADGCPVMAVCSSLLLTAAVGARLELVSYPPVSPAGPCRLPEHAVLRWLARFRRDGLAGWSG